MHLRKTAHLLGISRNTIYQLPQILPKQNTDFVHFIYCTNMLNWPLNLALLHGKKKRQRLFALSVNSDRCYLH